MKTIVWTLFACSTAACAMTEAPDQADPSDTVATDSPIIGGATDTGDPCVVGVFAHAPGSTSGSLCTGTIIGPHTVLTAAHCVNPAVIGNGQQIDLLPGTNLDQAPIATISSTFNPAWDLGNLEACHDEGIIHTAVALRPLCSTAGFASDLQVTLVGYGTNTHGNTGAGTKRTLLVSVADFDSVKIHDGDSSHQTCHGDSGGPAFQLGRVVGVTSFGTDNGPGDVCEGGGFHCRIDADLGFINSNLN